jgi:predicted hydrocarbon binding protein
MNAMAQHIDLRARSMVALTSATLEALRHTLVRDAGLAGATQLQDAGFAGGRALYEAFREWLAGRTDVDAGELPTSEFGEHASGFFREAGWGSFRLGALGDAVATVDTTDWREADPSASLEHPGCHLTTGMLAGFFAAAGDAPIAALEVECRAAGSERCRFLIGAGPVLTHVFEQVERGVGYEAALKTG